MCTMSVHLCKAKPKLELGIHLLDHIGLVELPGYCATELWRLLCSLYSGL